MFSLFGGRKEYYTSKTRTNGQNEASTETPNVPRSGRGTSSEAIEDNGIVGDYNQSQLPPSPYGTNSYEIHSNDDLAPSELSSSVYGSSYNLPDTPSNDEQHIASPQPLGSKNTMNNMVPPSSDPTKQGDRRQQAQQQQQQQQQQQRDPRSSSTGVHAISYVTQAPEHGYAAGYEDDLSTLGDESIIRRSRQSQQKQQELRQKQKEYQELQNKKEKNKKGKKPSQKAKFYDRTKIDKAHTRSTEEVSPSNASRESGDLSFSFSNVLDVNEKIPASSKHGYDITDDSRTDNEEGKSMLDAVYGTNGEGDDPDGKKAQESSFVQRNKWTIIKFIVVLSLFLLMTAAAVLIVSLLHMRNIANSTTETSMMGNGGGYDASDYASNGAPYWTVSVAPAPAPTRPFSPISIQSDNAVVIDSLTTSSPQPPPVPVPVTTEAPTGSPQTEVVVTQSPTEGAKTNMPFNAPSSSEFTSSTTDAEVTENPSSTQLIVNSITAAEKAKVGTDLKFVIANFSPSSLPLLGNSGSAQSKAFDWMTKDPSYWNMDISTIVQRWTLAVFYHSTGGPNWKTEQFPEIYAEGKSPWLSYSDECLWISSNQGSRGRICDSDNNYFAIHLRDVGLTGTIPAELALLSDHMRLLFVNSNELSGSLPSELGQLTALEKLNLQYNNLSGSLPSEIGMWGALTIAAMGNNKFLGPIPPETGSWGSMETIGFENNSFYGPLPKEWGNIPNIEKISVELNFLTGTIPYDFNYMHQLTSLSMHSNDLTGVMQWGLCPGCYSVEELKVDCEEVKCDCCTECFTDSAIVSDLQMGLGPENP